ncbi:hypothetical protein IW150_006804 [Coemansia sp. RSA 2607]|nr:hypothetical protein IW150_006804 [Coemansia sp. RSA 2607]
MTSPLGENEPLCKHTVPFPTPCTTWTAGQQVSVQFAPGGAPHGGGHCQYSLSYDGGNTFVVVYEVLEHCFGADNNQRDFSFTLPSTLPSSDKVVFAWTWVNAIGNREFYMNCADVAIKGGSGTYTGKQMTIANHAGYPTIPEFSGNYATGLDLYQNTKNITVSGSGSTSGSSGSSSNSGSSGGSSSSASSGGSSNSGSGSGSSSYPASAAPEATPTATYTASISSNGSYTPVSSAYTTSIVPVSTAPALTTVSTYASSEPAPQGHNAGDGSNGSSSSGGSCSNGAMQCSGSGYQVCIAGTWSQTYSCGPGTTCCGGGDSGVYCGWS